MPTNVLDVAVIGCPALSHLTPLGLRDKTGRIPTDGGTRAPHHDIPGAQQSPNAW